MSFKPLHTFKVSITREEKVTTTRMEGDKEIAVTEPKVQTVLVPIVLKEPTRKEKAEVALFNSIQQSRAVDMGLLPKVVMIQKLSKDGNNPLTGEEDSTLRELNTQLADMTKRSVRMGFDPKSEADQEARARLNTDIFIAQNKVAAITEAYQSVFAHTSEVYAQHRVLTWLILHLSYLKTAPDRYEPLFPGTSFDSREDKLGEMEDAKDPIYMAAIQQLSTCWMWYLYGYASDAAGFTELQAKQDEIDKQLAEIRRQQEELQAAKVVETPAAEAPVAELTAPDPVPAPVAPTPEVTTS